MRLCWFVPFQHFIFMCSLFVDTNMCFGFGILLLLVQNHIDARTILNEKNMEKRKTKKKKQKQNVGKKNTKRKNRVMVLVLADAFLYVISTHSPFLLHILKFILNRFFSLFLGFYYVYRWTDPYSMLIFIYGIRKTLGKFYVTRLFIRIFWRKIFPLFYSSVTNAALLILREKSLRFPLSFNIRSIISPNRSSSRFLFEKDFVIVSCQDAYIKMRQSIAHASHLKEKLGIESLSPQLRSKIFNSW